MTEDDILTSIRTRAALRRRARLAGLAAAASMLIVGAIAVGLARAPSDEARTVLADGTGTSFGSTTFAVSSTVVVPGTADPGTTTSSGAPNAPVTTATTSAPNTTVPFPQTTTSIQQGPLPTVGPTTSSTALPGDPNGDCGEVVPIAGYPTTFLMPADGVDCFIARFNARVPARFVVIAFADLPGGGIDETTSERRTYTTSGGGTVDVSVERRSPGVGPWTPYTSKQRCAEVTKVWPSAAQLTVGGCA